MIRRTFAFGGLGRVATAFAVVLGLVAVVGGALAPTAGASESTYVIGNIGTYTGPVSGDYGSDRQVLTAWEKAVNAAGGINGHKVKVIALDDQGNPTVSLQDAQQLVQQDHVLAVVDDNSNGGTNYGSYLEQQGVPLIGATSNPPASTDTLFFPVGASTLGEINGEAAAAKLVDAKKIAFIYCAEAAVCAEVVPLIKADASANGAEVSYVSAAAESAPSYTSYCLAAKQSGATAVLTALASPAVISIAQGCAQQGYNPHFLLGGAPVGPTFEATSGLNGSLAVEGVFPWIQDNTPATEAFHNAVKKYEPSITKSSTWNATTAYTWTGAELFQAAAAKMKGDSPSALATALYSLKGVTLGGLLAPETFSSTKQANPQCYTLMKQESGKYAVLNDGHFTCPASSASS